LKALNFKTPMEKVIEFWKKEPKKFNKNPYHYVLEANN